MKNSNHGYLFTVADDGPGIPLEYSQNIFEMFSRLKSQDEVEGSGIGLSIVKRIIEKFGGDIKLAPSDRGQNLKFIGPRKRLNEESLVFTSKSVSIQFSIPIHEPSHVIVS